jgi:hypothetical protein
MTEQLRTAGRCGGQPLASFAARRAIVFGRRRRIARDVCSLEANFVPLDDQVRGFYFLLPALMPVNQILIYTLRRGG